MNGVDLFGAAARQSATLRETVHRPWPLPPGSFRQGQTWECLLFAHWRLEEHVVRRLVPPELTLDTFEGAAWLGITPFRLSGLRVRGMLPLPGISSFLELNVRTYVRFRDQPGIFFFSLDAESALAVEAARRLYKLPYFVARMSAREFGRRIEFSSERRDFATRPHVFEGWYHPVGSIFEAVQGTLEYFLTERYCMYAVDRRQRMYRADIHHRPWPLQEAQAHVEMNSMAPTGVQLSEQPTTLHYAIRQDVVIWPLVPADPPGRPPAA